ncbi:MAG: hypothetical protein AAB576_11640 [Elusimicrobiota bacterium]
MKGQVVYMYAYDVAYEIDLQKVRELLAKRTQFMELRPDKTIPRDFPLYKPLCIEEPAITAQTSIGPLTLRREIKIFAIGALSISLEADFEVGEIGDLLAYHSLKLADGRTLDDLAAEVCDSVLSTIGPYLTRPSPDKGNPEAYTIFCLFSGLQGAPVGRSGAPDAQRWLAVHRQAVAGLLTEEKSFDRLSEAEIEETTKHNYSYTTSDLLVVDWNSALIVDPEGRPDELLYIIETANLQLTEFRLYDRTLEEFLDKAYDEIEAYSRKPPLLKGPGPVLSRLRGMRMDLAKMADELSNITKFFGDWHLARLYMACADRFHLKEWQDSVDSKLKTLDSLYNLLLTDITNRRMLLLEVAIVALFIADLILIGMQLK